MQTKPTHVSSSGIEWFFFFNVKVNPYIDGEDNMKKHTRHASMQRNEKDKRNKIQSAESSL